MSLKDWAQNFPTCPQCGLLCKYNIWAAAWQNQQNDLWPSEDSDQPGLSLSPSLIRVFAVCRKKPWILSYPLSAHRRLGRWVTSFCRFCHAVAHLKFQVWVNMVDQNHLEKILYIAKVGKAYWITKGKLKLTSHQSYSIVFIWATSWQNLSLGVWDHVRHAKHNLQLSHVKSKPSSGIYDQVRLNPACSATETSKSWIFGFTCSNYICSSGNRAKLHHA